jgi:hypothetical protein
VRGVDRDREDRPLDAVASSSRVPISTPALAPGSTRRSQPAPVANGWVLPLGRLGDLATAISTNVTSPAAGYVGRAIHWVN